MINSEIISNNQEIKDKNNKFIEEIKYLMKYIIEKNNNNKIHKISLFKIRGFDPHIIFNKIDNLSSGYISLKDFEEFFSKNNFKVEKDIILLFIREFNKQEKDNTLKIKDFCNYFNFDIDKREINLGELNFDKKEIKKLFFNLIDSEFKLIKEKNELINEIIKIKEFSSFEAFYIISNDQNYIDYNSLKLFLGDQYKKNEIKELIYRLDLNNNGKISYDEFQDLFFPFQSHLNLEKTNNDEENNKYNGDDEEQNYNIKIKNENDYNINPYKNNTLTEPKIVNNSISINNEKENEHNNIMNNLNSNIFINTNSVNQNKLNNESSYIFDKNKYDSDKFKIKYDENLINEIDEKIKANNIINNDNLNDNYFKNTSLENDNNNENIIKVENNFGNKFEENHNLKSINKEKNNSDINHSNQQNENININSDISPSKKYSEKNNTSHNSNNNSYQITENEEKFKEYQNFADIFTEEEKYIINLFIDYIYSVTLLENKAENLRESISLCEDIYLLDIFNKFDQNKNNLISKENFIDICKREYYIFPTENQIKLIFKRYDIDNDCQLNFDEFKNLIKPLKKEYLNLYDKDENINSNISFDSKKKIIDFLKTIFENESIIYELKSKLISKKAFNFINLWGLLMKYSQDNTVLNKKEFNYFLENFGCYLTKYELDIIFYKLAK